MPVPIELIYRLSDRDAALPLWGFMSDTLIQQAAAASVLTDIAAFRGLIPQGHILNITQVGIQGFPGLGQSVTELFALIIDNPGPINVNNLIEDTIPFRAAAPGANETVTATRSVDIIATPDEYGIRAIAIFNAGVQVNTVRLFFSGYVIPRGNFSRF